jgi:NadR type nicotinamide-nucleotide adenylyltransferase
MPLFKIVITGPESTGKSTLAEQLSKYFGEGLITEFARDYVSNLNRPYNYSDLVLIAQKQIEELDIYKAKVKDGIVFLDTYLIITKVWFEVVYKAAPEWITEKLLQSEIDLFLLCEPDLPWEQDGVRENGGEMRNRLFNEYEKNLIKYKLAYGKVSGTGRERTDCAIKHIESFISRKLP